MTDDAGPSQAAPAPTAVVCSGAVRQRDPAIFSGTDDHDVEDWLAEYERVSAHNRWDDRSKVTNAIFYLTGVANLWFRNHEAEFTTWSAFTETLTSFFGRPAVRRLRAEHRLRGRAQQSGETFTSYIEDVIDLCKRVNASMTEADKIRHIMKGIDDDAFHMLVAKNPTTVAQVIELCQSFDELRKQRLATRSTSLQSADLSALEPGYVSADHSGLLPQIQQYIREEVARQLSLVTCVAEPASTLDPSLRRVIQAQVTEALPPTPPPPPVTAPLTYAAALQRPAARPMPTTSRPAASFYSSPLPVRPVHVPLSPSRPSINPWRTPDNRPICFACGIPGHVARFCRRRGLYYRHDAPNLSYVPEEPSHRSVPDPSDSYSRRTAFNSRRSPSPRRRSLSPMLRRSSSGQEEN